VRSLLRLLIKAISRYATNQEIIGEQLKILNGHIERIYPPPAILGKGVTAEEPMLGDDPEFLSLAADAENTLYLELGRAPTVEEIMARARIYQERRDPLPARRALIDGEF
jgi:hypothetical protein